MRVKKGQVDWPVIFPDKALEGQHMNDAAQEAQNPSTASKGALRLA